MSVWSRIVALAARAFDHDGVEPAPADKCAPDVDDVGFTAAVVGLAAKMAKADGVTTDAEMAAAAMVFRPPPGEERAFRLAFSIAQQTVLGFESYARQIGRKYRDRPCLLEDVLDGLFHIAAADGAVTPAELTFLEQVATLFGFSGPDFRRIKAAHLGAEPGDPYAVLGLAPGATFEEARAAWRRLVGESHPDRLIAQGAPAAFVAIAQAKTAALNAAFAQVREEHARFATAD
jgi:DnaJ like chaperone protein